MDAVLFVDSDCVFLSPPDEVFDYIYHFHPKQIMGIVAEAERKGEGFYNDAFLVRSNYSFYGVAGLNTGVMVLNLKEMRRLRVENHLMDIHHEFNGTFIVGDQDMLNIYLNRTPEQVFVLPCEYNYRTDHCQGLTSCSAINGVKIMHASRFCAFIFQTIIFGRIYKAFLMVR